MGMRPHNMDGNHIGCGVLDLPHTEFEDKNNLEPDCLNFWYSNGVRIPGEPTIPDDMSQPEVKCVGQAGHNPAEHPLESPGMLQVLPPCMDHVEHWEVFLPDVMETTLASSETVARITVTALLWVLMLRNTSGRTYL